MNIRKALIQDMDDIMRIYEEARVFMRSIGNGSQWGDAHPRRDIIVEDIENGDLYVCAGGQNDISGVFFYKEYDEPTYRRIYGGAWLNDEPYGVVHRLAGSRTAKGIGAFCLDWCEKQCRNIRIDTHRDNIVMRKVLEKSFEKRIDVFSELYNGLHIEPQNPEIYSSYLDWVCESVLNSEKSQKDLKGMLTHIYKAKEICLEVCETYNQKMLLHIDIYGGNIVSDGVGYRLIDPKGFIGDPVFETGQFIFAECCENGVEPEKIEIMLNRLEQGINIPQQILRQCFYIETVRFISYYAAIYGASQDDIERIEFAEKVMHGIE